MPDRRFLSSLYTYAWDLTDEGLDRSLGRIADVAGCRQVMLALSYHLATYFLPHNPKRPFYYGEDGALYFTPQLSRYAKTRIRPRVSEVVAGPNYLDRIVEAIHKRGLEFSAWIVYMFNHHLAGKYREFAKHDAFGNPYPAQLSPSPVDVQEYVLALTADIVENYKPVSVHVESLSRLRWNYGFQNPKVLSRISPRCEFLLSLCFNPASMANANAGGMDVERFRQDVAEWLRPRLARLPAKEDLQPVTEQWIAEAFNGQLKQYLDVGRKRTTDLWLRVAEVIHRGGAKVQSGLAGPVSSGRDDLDPAINRRLDAVTVGPVPGDEAGRGRVQEITGQIAKGGIVLVSLQPGQFTASGPLQQQVHEAAAAGAGGATFYNYGLLREEQLGFIGTALRTL